ncbi:MAG: iron ABC transporter permease [Planctomycetota bacterium]|jgi:iron complex transport system permease protein|nr:iron ABC transporter permease [Planctomycetota bacterium]
MRLSFYLLIPLALAVLFGGVMFGAEFIAPADFWRDGALDVVVKIRLTRMAAAFIIGGALALSGAGLQVVLRNPLAEPFTLGISGGAGLGAATALICGWRLGNVYAVQFSAFVGALAALAVVLWVSRAGARGENSLLLSGIITGTMASGVLMYLLTGASHAELASVTWWLLGDLQGVNGDFLLPTAFWLILAGFVFWRYGGDLNALALGREAAWNFGVNPRRLTVVVVALASLLAAATVAMAGIIGFCGLIIPAIARKFFGCDHRRLVAPLVLTGGTFLMLGDILSRVVFREREIPLGVITAIAGGALFLYLLNRGRTA